uniref:Ig-like domain-containing protein n=1 Tax=Loxodonta africana TaxID=9785 RepID=G3U751_LOXAF
SSPWVVRIIFTHITLLSTLGSCLMLSGPSTVTGIVGETLSVQCRYEEKFKESDKFWCREPALRPCYKIVETSGSEREKRRGRVSISDHPAQLSFTVTMTKLTVEDAGKYWCGIDITWLRDARLPFDPTFQVVVSVSPAEPHPHTSTRTAGTSSVPAPRSSTPTSTTTSTTTTDCPIPSKSPLRSVHFLLLIFLKVPLFLSILSAVLWVNRPQRGPRGRWSQPNYENQ